MKYDTKYNVTINIIWKLHYTHTHTHNIYICTCMYACVYKYL